MKKWIVGSIIFLFLIVGCSAVQYDVFVTIPSDSTPSDSTLASGQKQIKKHKPQAKSLRRLLSLLQCRRRRRQNTP